jgi:hypothetical protein
VHTHRRHSKEAQRSNGSRWGFAAAALQTLGFSKVTLRPPYRAPPWQAPPPVQSLPLSRVLALHSKQASKRARVCACVHVCVLWRRRQRQLRGRFGVAVASCHCGFALAQASAQLDWHWYVLFVLVLWASSSSEHNREAGAGSLICLTPTTTPARSKGGVQTVQSLVVSSRPHRNTHREVGGCFI